MKQLKVNLVSFLILLLFSQLAVAERTIDLKTTTYNISTDHTVYEFLKIETIADKSDPQKGEVLVSCHQDDCKPFVARYDSGTVVELLDRTKLNTLALSDFSGKKAVLSVRNRDNYLISIRFKP